MVAGIPDMERLVEVGRSLFAVIAPGADTVFRAIPEDDAVVVIRPVRGGGSIFVGRDETVLYAGSAMDFDRGLAAFRAGNRTPREQFVPPPAPGAAATTPVPVPDQARLEAVGRRLFAGLAPDLLLQVVPVAADGAVVVVHEVPGGGAIFVAPDETVLWTAADRESLRAGQEAFRAGRRTPVEAIRR